MMGDKIELIEEDVAMLIKTDPEDSEDFVFFKKNKFHICGICWRLLNGFIDLRHQCLHDGGIFEDDTDGIFRIEKVNR